MSEEQALIDGHEYYDEEYKEGAYFSTVIKWVLGISGFLIMAGIFTWMVLPTPPDELIPMVRVSEVAPHRQLKPGSKNRLVLVGDVHGMHDQLTQLLEKIDYNRKHDQLILLGDFISKGPNSIKVLDDAIKYDAIGVRGNHEDEILDIYAQFRDITPPLTYPPHASKSAATFGRPIPKASLKPTEGEEWLQPTITVHPRAAETASHHDIAEQGLDESKDRVLALALSPAHIDFLQKCPAMLKLGHVKSNGGEGVAVHGGLLWNITDLEDQPPEIIFRLRSLLPPDYKIPTDDKGAPWARLYNAEQKKISKPKDRVTVFYGHDAGRGLKLRKYTKGLDTRCVRGGDLTAMVLSMTKKGKVKSDIFQIDCPSFGESAKHS